MPIPDSDTHPKPSRFRRILRWLSRWTVRPVAVALSLLLTGLFIGVVTVMGLLYYYSKALPDSSSLADYQPTGMTRVYAANSELIGEYARQKRIFVPFEEIPHKVIHAFIAAEDKTFYEHRGIDPMGITRALIKNIRNYANDDKSLVGGSTITQQVVKNFLLTREKSIDRKIKEAILALRITQNYTKDRILELYLNEIYLGMGAYGVASAAQEFFDKELDELTTEEAALLAAMPKAPSTYDPQRNPHAAIDRRNNYVLPRMFEEGYINAAELERALSSPLGIKQRIAQDAINSGYYAEEVRRWLLETYGEDATYENNLFVKTAMQPATQSLLDKALRNALTTYDRRHGFRGAITQLDTLEGWENALDDLARDTPLFEDQQLAVILSLDGSDAVIGMTTSPDQASDDEEAVQENTALLTASYLKWARPVRPSGAIGAAPKKVSDILQTGDVIIVTPTNDPLRNKLAIWALHQIPKVSGAMVAMRPQTGEVLAMSGGYSYMDSEFNRATQAKRQPGSSFKPFVYMAALERGFTPSSIVEDAPIEISQGPGKPPWRPKNYGRDFLGATTLRNGLEKSRNLMTVRLAQMIGLDAVSHVGERLGMYQNMPSNFANVLGSYETTVMHMVTAYSMLVNGGLQVEPVMVKRVDNRNGEVLYRADARDCPKCRVTKEQPRIAVNPPILANTRERVIDPRIAYQMVTLLKGVVQRGTATRAKVLNFDVAGKTGTTNDSRDAWFVGMTQDLVVGIYIGFDTPKSLGRRETGGRVALPAFVSFMKDHYSETPPADFVRPTGVIDINVDRYTGVPPLPWQQSTAIITETFVTGGSIFIPGDKITDDLQDDGALEDNQLSDPSYNEFVDYDAANQLYRAQPGYRNSHATQPSYERNVYRDDVYSPSGQPYQSRDDSYIVPPESQNVPSDALSTNSDYVPLTPSGNNSPAPKKPKTNTPEPRRSYQPYSNTTTLPPRHPSRRFEDRYRSPNRKQKPARTTQPSPGTGGLY